MRRLVIITLLVALPGLLFAREQDRSLRQVKASYYYLDGIQALSEGENYLAARYFARVLKEDPAHAAAYYQLSQLVEGAGKPELALEYARQARQLDTLERSYTHQYGRLLAVNGQYAEAEALFEQWLSKNPVDREAQSLLAALKMSVGKPRQGKELIDTLEARYGIQSGPLIEMKRQYLIVSKQYDEAFDYLEQVCESNPNNASYRVAWAELAAALHRDSLALEQYRTAIALDSVSVGPRIALAEYFRIKERYADYFEALKPVFDRRDDFSTRQKIDYFITYLEQPELLRRSVASVVLLSNRILESDPENTDAQAFYVRFLLYTDQVGLARKYLDQLLEKPAPPIFYMLAIQLADFQKQPEQAEQYIQAGTLRFPKDPDIGFAVLSVRLNQGDTLAFFAKAHEMLRGEKNDSIAATIYQFCGDIAHNQGNMPQTYDYYKKSLRRNPDNAGVLNNYAYFLSLEQRDLQRALAMSNRSNELSPQNATYLDTQAWILYELGEYSKAQEVIRRALALDQSNNPEIMLHYGDILRAMGEYFLAKTYWERARAAGASPVEIRRRIESLPPEQQ